MKLFLFRLSNLLLLISIGFVIFFNSYSLYKINEKYNRTIENNIKLGRDWKPNFISEYEIGQLIFYSTLAISILLIFNWLVFGKFSFKINKEKYVEDLVDLKKFVFRISRVFSIFCIITFTIYLMSKAVDYLQFSRIRLMRELEFLYISSFVFFFNIVFFRECSLWINKEVKVQKIFNLTNIKYTLSKIILVICVCLFLQYCIEILYFYIRRNEINFERGLIYLFLSLTSLIYNYLSFGKIRFVVHKPNENKI
tara:strand:+ start:224 stop:982 length:759 start_codon:yes stop_codon:yes gene_type:complete